MRSCVLVMIVLLSFSSMAQKKDEYKSKFFAQTTFMSVEAGRDFLVGDNFFVQTGIGLGAGYDVGNNSMSMALNFSKPIPYLKASADWYYNKNNRIDKNRTLANNSGNYLGIQTKYSFGDNDEYNSYLNKVLVSEAHWGIKRSFGGVMYYKVQLGVAHYKDYDTTYTEVYPSIGLFIGATF
ncbi:hypothetical protein LNQ81_00095 [Myroides sp. M-43]|uniref:hypothetical protein n=1 Tax=Myroides oncorhynchi TaxID=2893756 RepID=UPI001E2E46CB|nr:hypothetical protein [Myroides oncorhynchi]MCC9041139.1 hypothetical protein [Myroides oncorhynchi]